MTNGLMKLQPYIGMYTKMDLMILARAQNGGHLYMGCQ